MRARRPPPIELLCVRQVALVHENGNPIEKPLLAGFGRASDLDAVAEAPSFSDRDTNLTIAQMLQHLPVERWQRPLDRDRITLMSAFFDAGPHLMPNPVLLAVNPDLAGAVSVDQHGELFKVTIDRREGALWILDGQHRISALAQSAQADNPVPFVLLYDEGGNYSRAEFASIFAQVTTKAVPLDEPHKTWLQYSFKLGDYEGAGGTAKRKAFETIVWLGSCEYPTRKRIRNRFAGYIRFNPWFPSRTEKVGVEDLEGVFSFPAQNFAAIVFEHYYSAPPANALKPKELAGEIALAYAALRAIIPAPQDQMAFFKTGNILIQEGFLAGVLAYLRARGAPSNWQSVLRRLKLDRGGWDFRGRQVDTGGQFGRPSRNAAMQTFTQVFEANALPQGVTEFVSYLLGDTGATVNLRFLDAVTLGVVQEVEIVGRNRIPLNNLLKSGRLLKIENSPNVGMVWLDSDTRNPAYWTTATRAARGATGVSTDDLAGDLSRQGAGGAVNLTVWYETYGGEQLSARLIFT